MVDILIYTPIRQKFKFMRATDLKGNEYNPFLRYLFNKVSKDLNLSDAFNKGDEVVQFFKSIPK